MKLQIRCGVHIGCEQLWFHTGTPRQGARKRVETLENCGDDDNEQSMAKGKGISNRFSLATIRTRTLHIMTALLKLYKIYACAEFLFKI